MFQVQHLSHPISLLSVLLVLLGGCGGTDAGSSPSSLSHEAKTYFYILRTPPEELRRAERKHILNTLASNGSQTLASEAQMVDTDHGYLWIVTTSKHVLCIAQSRGVGCAPIKAAVNKGVFLGVFQPPTKQRSGFHDFLVQGVVPDSVKRVVVVIGEARTHTIAVKENVFSVEAEQPVHVKRLLRH